MNALFTRFSLTSTMKSIFIFLSCTTQPSIRETPPPKKDLGVDLSLLVGAFQSCAQYGTRDLISYCIYQNADRIHTIDEVNTYCSLTENWEEACRHSWAVKRMHNAKPSDFNDLIVGCAGFSDCAMEFIDGLPTRDSALQRSRCKKYARADKQDCLRHAMQMWANMRPTQEEAAAFLQDQPYLDNIEIEYVAEVAYCNNWNICADKTNNHIKCRAFTKELYKTSKRCRQNWGKQPPP